MFSMLGVNVLQSVGERAFGKRLSLGCFIWTEPNLKPLRRARPEKERMRCMTRAARARS